MDEIGSVGIDVQANLLRILQEREFERVGGHRVIKADVRVIAATNKNLEEAVEDDTFRGDLYYRLNVFPIYMPPLRERKTDILLLADYFLEKYAKENNKDIKRFSTPAIDMLMGYHWPGNVRELENVVERALILNPKGPLNFKHLDRIQTQPTNDFAELNNEPSELNQVIVNHIRTVLSKTKGKIHGKGGAAELLGMNPSTLRNRMNKLGIQYGRSKKKKGHP